MGEWTLKQPREWEEQTGTTVFGDDGRLIAECHTLRPDLKRPIKESRVHARMIAAAPYMLEALQWAVIAIERGQGLGALDFVKTAISKAKGEV